METIAQAKTTVNETFNSYIPKAGIPSNYVSVFDCRKFFCIDYGVDVYQKGAVKVLQGLVNRETPQLYIIMCDEDQFWLDNMIDKGYIKGISSEISSVAELYSKYSKYYSGAVIIDQALTMGTLIATTPAACENLIPVTEEINAVLDLDVKLDLRGKFKTNAEGLLWAWDTYKTQLNTSLFAVYHPNVYGNWEGCIDYIVQQRGFIFWVSESSAEKVKGVDGDAECRAIEQIFSDSPDMGLVIGYWWNGSGDSFTGIGEMAGVRLTCAYGKVFLPCGINNLSVHSGFKAKIKFTQTRKAKPDTVEDKLYVALTTTDGDAVNTYYNQLNKWFESNSYGSVPMGWGMGVLMYDAAPDIAAWYYERGDVNNEFFAEVSGLSYINPREFGMSLDENRRQSLWNDFFAYTNKYVSLMDMSAMRIVTRSLRWDCEMLEMYTEKLSGIRTLLPDWGNTYTEKTNLADGAYILNGLNVFHAMNDWQGGAEGLANQIIALNTQRTETGGGPAFAQGFVNIWYYPCGMDDMAKVAELVKAACGDNVVFVTPSSLADLYELYSKDNPEFAEPPAVLYNNSKLSSDAGEDFTAGTSTDGKIEYKLEIIPGSAVEAKYIYSGAIQTEITDIGGKPARFADMTQSFIYRIPLLDNAISLKLIFIIANQYSVKISSDDIEYFPLLMSDAPNEQSRSNLIRKQIEIDSKYLESDSIYIKIADQYPADGWGGLLFGLTVKEKVTE